MQKRRALSTAEVEYRAATYATKDIIWLRSLLRELNRRQRTATVLKEDNSACVKMIQNPVVSGRNKHIEPDMHFVRDHHQLQHIRVKKIDTEKQIADLLTKNLARDLFERHRDSLLSDVRTAGD